MNNNTIAQASENNPEVKQSAHSEEDFRAALECPDAAHLLKKLPEEMTGEHPVCCIVKELKSRPGAEYSHDDSLVALSLS